MTAPPVVLLVFLPVLLMAACSSPTEPEALDFQRLSPETPSFEFNSGVAEKERLSTCG